MMSAEFAPKIGGVDATSAEIGNQMADSGSKLGQNRPEIPRNWPLPVRVWTSTQIRSILADARGRLPELGRMYPEIDNFDRSRPNFGQLGLESAKHKGERDRS